MTTEQPTSVSYENVPCTRCGGSGHYSFNQISGTRCFKCGGAGVQLTKRGKATLAFADSLLDRKVEEACASAESFQYFDAFRGRRYRNCTAVEVPGCFVGPNGKLEPSYEVRSSKGTVVVVAGKGTKVRLHPTQEQINQIMAFQDSLTKNATPRKR